MTERCHRLAECPHAAASIFTRTANRPQPHDVAMFVHRHSHRGLQSCRSSGLSHSYLHDSTM